jgi:hypothetical protein
VTRCQCGFCRADRYATRIGIAVSVLGLGYFIVHLALIP